jgi:hypothetical protein
MDLLIDSKGIIQCVYSEAIPLAELGTALIRRASHVEPDAQGRWWADLSPVAGPTLGPFAARSHALAAEQHWLETRWLTSVRFEHAYPPNRP